MAPVIWQHTEEDELPSFRWRTFHDRQMVEGVAFGLMVFGGPEWSVHLYLGWWLIGIERTREEDG